MCSQKKATLSEEEFEAWQEQHTCNGNFGGSSHHYQRLPKEYGEGVRITTSCINI